ncbi:hypothetical protein HY251_16270 [bacterium]|nr:hypothetical protein [bacterium]
MSADGQFLSKRTGGGFDRRPALDEDEKVTIACRCGVVVTVRWKHREAVTCFGCKRSFAPPPHVVGSPLVWKPQEAKRPSPAVVARVRRRTAVSVLVALLLLALLLAFGLWLAVQAGSSGP